MAQDAPLSIVHKTLISESAGEPPEGMYLAASSMVNRATQSGKTLEEIVNAPHQYSGRWRKDLDQFVMKQPPYVRQQAVQALQRAQQSPAPDVTHYLALPLYLSPHKPGWSDQSKQHHIPFLKTVGHHAFFGGKSR